MVVEFNRFLYRSLVLAFLIGSISQALFSTLYDGRDYPGRILSIGFIWVITCVFHYFLIKAVYQQPKSFNRVFMMQTTARLLLYLTCILVYILLFKEYAMQFALVFLASYFIFAVFEVLSVLKFVKNNNAGMTGKIKLSN
jgi:hypothetical protein